MNLDNAIGYLAVFGLGVIACTDTPAGVFLRASVVLPFYWLGWIDTNTLNYLAGV